jgi:hypothetical protein
MLGTFDAVVAADQQHITHRQIGFAGLGHFQRLLMAVCKVEVSPIVASNADRSAACVSMQ